MKSVFGKPDRKGQAEDGMIRSEYPAWMMDNQINELGEEMDTLERDLEGGYIPSDNIFDAKAALKNMQDRLDEIVISRPEYSRHEQNLMLDELKRLDKEVSETLYSRYDQLKGKGSIARPQQEADLNDKPCIKLNPVIAEAFNVSNITDDGRVSRNAADRVRKIMYHYFNMGSASRELIRSENNSGRSKPMVGYTNEVFAKAHERIFGKKKMTSNMDESDTMSRSNRRPMISRQPVSETTYTKEELKTKLGVLEKQLGAIENVQESEVFTKDEHPENVNKTVKKKRMFKSWKCDELDCDFEGTTAQKGIHIMNHKKANKKAEELTGAR